MSESRIQSNSSSPRLNTESAVGRFPSILRYTGRALLVGAILYSGFVAWQIVSEWRNVGGQNNVHDTLPDEPDWISILAGEWQFEGLPFRISSTEIAADKLGSRLESLPDAQAQAPAAPALPQALVRILENQGATPERIGEFRRYRLQREDLRIFAFTTGDGPAEQIVSMRAAVRHGREGISERRWSLVEAHDHPPAAAAPDGKSRLPPLTEDCLMVAVRYDARGHELAKLFSHQGPPKFLNSWKEAGWSVISQEATSESEQSWICRHGDDACIVSRVATPGHDGSLYFMMDVRAK